MRVISVYLFWIIKEKKNIMISIRELFTEHLTWFLFFFHHWNAFHLRAIFLFWFSFFRSFERRCKRYFACCNLVWVCSLLGRLELVRGNWISMKLPACLSESDTHRHDRRDWDERERENHYYSHRIVCVLAAINWMGLIVDGS